MTETNDPLRLSIGGAIGPQREGFRVIDRKTGDEAYPLTLDGEPVADDTVDDAVAGHVLEHFSHRETLTVLKDWVRALKPGGRLRIGVPDFDYIARKYVSGGETQHPLESYVMGGHADTDDRHGTLFTDRKLRLLMHAAGLRRVRRWKSDVQDCSSLEVSLNLEGYKAEPVEVKGVHAVMSVPRYGPTATFACLVNAFTALGVKLRMGWGAFWHQALSQAIEQCIADGAEYVLSCDYDSLFTPDDVKELYRLIGTHPEADAICALQMRRGATGALLTVRDENGDPMPEVPAEWFDRDLIKAATGHFGLTIFRASAFAKLPRPWFQAVPDPSGGWGAGRVDCDVQMWLNWAEVGNTLYQANYVHAGHLEEFALWADRDLRPLTQELSEWREHGKPTEALR